jgi:thymidylate synthase ThyX
MSKRIKLPFLPQFKNPMLSGQSTITSRTRRYGHFGDTFLAWGEVWEIREVTRALLSSVRDRYYHQEGFPSPEAFEACWKALHRSKGYDPEQVVYAHSFIKLEKGKESQPCLL